MGGDSKSQVQGLESTKTHFIWKKKLFLIIKVELVYNRECYNMMVEFNAIFDHSQRYLIESHRIIKDEFNESVFVSGLKDPKGQ